MSNHQSKSPRCLAIQKQAREDVFLQLEIPHADPVTPIASRRELEAPNVPGFDETVPYGFEPSQAVEDLIGECQDACPPPQECEESQSDHIEEVWDEAFAPEKRAGATIGTCKTLFESYRDEQVLEGADILGPFESDEEWELAKWLIKNVGHNQAEEFLKLPIVSSLQHFDVNILTYSHPTLV